MKLPFITNRSILLVVVAFYSLCSCTRVNGGSALTATITLTETSIEWQNWYESVKIEAWVNDSVRVRVSPYGDIIEEPHDDFVSAHPEKIVKSLQYARTSRINATSAHLVNGMMRVEVNYVFDSYRVTFFRRMESGTEMILLDEYWQAHDYVPRYLEPLAHGASTYKARVCFQSALNERFYGLGQVPHGALDQSGMTIDLEHFNGRTVIPFVLSSRRYGLIWNHAGTGSISLGKERIQFTADALRQIDYVVLTGVAYRDILARLADATGHAPVMPYFATGFWQSKLRYASQDEVARVVDEFRRRKLPISVLVIDYFHWRHFGDWAFDPIVFPRPDQMIAHLGDIQPVVSVWPTVEQTGASFQDMASQGLLTRNELGTPLVGEFAGELFLSDQFNEKCRDYVFNKLRQGYISHKIFNFWLDCNEGDLGEDNSLNLGSTITRPSVVFSKGSTKQIGLAYPLYEQRMIFEGLSEENHSDIITISRSAFLGSQRYGALLHGGDTESTWEWMRSQMFAGLNVQLSGIVWWSDNPGGFANGDSQSPEFHELLIRWLERDAFTPVFRAHGVRNCNDTQGFMTCPNEPWSFTPQVLMVHTTLLWLRELLRPYIMAQMNIASTDGTPIQRPLWFDFEDIDPATATLVPDTFMFGPDILVAPILYPGVTSRDVYLPGNSDISWTSCWNTSITYASQQLIRQVKAPFGRPPLFFRTSADGVLNTLIPKDLCAQAILLMNRSEISDAEFTRIN